MRRRRLTTASPAVRYRHSISVALDANLSPMAPTVRVDTRSVAGRGECPICKAQASTYCCINGLSKRPLDSLKLSVVGQPEDPQTASGVLPGPWPTLQNEPEIEILFLPGRGEFSGQAECNIAVILDPSEGLPAGAANADIVFTACELDQIPNSHQMKLEDLREQLPRVA